MVLWDHLLYNLLNNISEFYPLLKSFDSFLQNKGALQKQKKQKRCRCFYKLYIAERNQQKKGRGKHCAGQEK